MRLNLRGLAVLPVLWGVFEAGTNPAAAGPALSTRWNRAEIPQAQCLARAEAALRSAGIEKTESTEQSRYGENGDYAGLIRCVTSNGLAFFVASGPDRAKTDALAGQLFRSWTDYK
ncbi:MAG: hypothetical protein JO245_05610 [Pseudolabrys sp.]|nr:hypothetical protein [Pseudolabrys sp.]